MLNPNSQNAHPAHLFAAAELLIPALRASPRLRRADVNAAMEQAFQGTSAQGCWSQRDSFLAVEVAAILALRYLEVPLSPELAVQFLATFEARLPTQTVRSEEQVASQHFSTPLALAWFSSHLAQINSADLVLEPRAATGMLAQWAGLGGGLHLNELDQPRQALLHQLFPTAKLTGFDAPRIASHVEQPPSVILMNPPFARNAQGHEDPAAAVRHIAAAISVLRPNGRVVAIMPDGFTSHGRRADVFRQVLQGTTVALHLRLERAFIRQGTSIPVRMLVVDKRPGRIDATVISRGTLADVLSEIGDPPTRLAREAEMPALPKLPPKPLLPRKVFAGFNSRPASSNPAAARGVNENCPIPLAYQLRDTVAHAEQAVGVYVAFRPQRLIFPVRPSIPRRSSSPQQWHRSRFPCRVTSPRCRHA